MVSEDLRQVLAILNDAGAYRVASKDVEWPPELRPAVFRALNMAYIVREETDGLVRLSLTQAGYRAIGAEPPWSRIVRDKLHRLIRRLPGLKR